MKKLYAFLFVAFLTSTTHAQIVNISDPVFKNLLVNTNCTDIDGGDYTINGDVDTNDDGEIQLSEALAIKVLELYGQDDYNLGGIEAFSNLEFIYFVFFNLSNVDLSGVPSLKYIEMHSGTIASMNLSGLVNLKSINGSFCHLPTIDFSSLASLDYLGLWQGTIETLDLSNLPSLREVNLSAPDGTTNNLSTINLDGLTHLEKLSCGNMGLTSIDLSDLVNLKELICGGNPNLTSLDLSNQDNLTLLGCRDNHLTTLDVSNLTQLEILECSNNLFTSIDISNLTLLQGLHCDGNQLTNLDITHAPLLTYLYCHDNLLTSLDLSNASNLWYLVCANNQLTSLNTTNLTKVKVINVRNNLFTSLDFSYSQSHTWNNLVFADNPNLTYINIKNGASFWFHQGDSFNASNCPNLQYICADEQNFSRINAPQAQVTSYCSFTPGGTFNTISGTLTFDLNNNGCDAGDVLSLNSKIKISSEFSEGVTFANASGHYLFYTGAGNFTVTPEFENPYFVISPAAADVLFDTADNLAFVQDFCITPNGIHSDVEISIVPLSVSRPGFDASYKLVYKNKGNQILSGTIVLTFDDTLMDLVAAFPASASQTLNALSWNYDNLMPFESRAIDLTMNINSPQETPAVTIGDTLSFTANINPVAGDETPNDNTFQFNQTVVGSFDPNDKTCLEGHTIAPEKIGDYLHYQIRFENKGTAAAENLVVKDILDTEKFDVASLQLVASSHPHVTRITGNKVEFIFEGINLPAGQDDEPGSHGFVAFKIRTKNTLVLGNSVSNKADIYFDYNFPIETQPATSVFSILRRDTFEDRSIEVYPNPTSDKLAINAGENIQSVSVRDAQGRLIESASPNASHTKMALGQYASGIYFVKITTAGGSKTQRIIKQ